MKENRLLSVISTDAIIEESAQIGPFCVIGPGVKIGKHTQIEANVVIDGNVVIGDNCRIGAGVILSSDVSRLGGTPSDQHVITISEKTTIEAHTFVCGDIHIGVEVWIGSHAVIQHGARIGNYCRIFSGAVLSSIPQDLKFNGENSTLVIGDYTTVREYATLNRGTGHRNTTIIGKHCLIMAYVHVAHDCVIGDYVILVNGVNMAGHVEIDDFAVVGGMSAIHQFVRIGKHVMISGGSLVTRDVPPYITAGRYPVQYEGLNKTGLHRRNFSPQQINEIQQIYKILFCSGFNFTNAVNNIENSVSISHEKTEIMIFLKDTKRGLIKGQHIEDIKEQESLISPNKDQ